MSGLWQMRAGGVWVPPPLGPVIPISPPAEQRRKERREYERDTVPLRCPGLAPQAWREWIDAMPAGIIAHRRALKPTSVTYPLATPAAAYWKLEEGNGLTRVDSSGNGEDLTDHGTVTQVAGKVNNAAGFASASSQYLERTSDAGLQMGTNVQFTITCWWYLHSVDGSHRGLVCKGQDDLAWANLEYMLWWRGPSSIMRFTISTGADGWTTGDSTLGTPTADTWYFTACGLSMSGANTNVWIETNRGAAVSSGGSSGKWAQAGSFAFRLGARTDGSYWDGRIDSVGLFKATLSAADLNYLYNSGNGQDPY